MVIPGSHKPNIRQTEFDAAAMRSAAISVDGITKAVEVHPNAGDALLFIEAVSHGRAARSNPGQRRIAIYRSGPIWGFFRHNYRPGAGLLDRLAPSARRIAMPHKEPDGPPALN